ncbi:MAG: HtaA domain-containing protein [Patulibacter sp.]
MTTITTRAPRRSPRRLIALATVSVAGLGLLPGVAAAFDVQSGTLTWDVPRETSPYTLAGYAASSIGQLGGVGKVEATAPATGASITATSTPAAGTGVKYPFAFPTTSTGAVGSYDPTTKTGAVNFEGTLTFTAHGSTFLTVVNPQLVFDAPQSARLVASGIVSAAMDATDQTPAAYDGTIFALDAASATSTENSDGTYTISNLVPSGTPVDAPTSYISSNTVFDSIRTFFLLGRANQGFSVTFTPVAEATPTATPEATPTATPEATPTATPEVTPTATPDATPTATPEVTPTATPTATPLAGSTQSLTVDGTVGDALNLTLNSTTASLGSFVPGVAADYDTSITGTATSTGPSVLTVQDTGTTPGYLLNGSHALAAPLKVSATSAATPTSSFVDLSGSAQSLLSFDAASGTPLTVALRQPIGASEGLTAGTYGKTLTFTLSAGTP